MSPDGTETGRTVIWRVCWFVRWFVRSLYARRHFSESTSPIFMNMAQMFSIGGLVV